MRLLPAVPKPLTLVAASLAAALAVGCGQTDPPMDMADAGDNPATDAAAGMTSEFVPEADQFGLEQFKIVFELEGQETGTRTLWIEDHGARVGMESDVMVYTEAQHQLYYWDGEQSYMQSLPDGEVTTAPLRVKASEPTSFATTSETNLTTVGYQKIGEKTVLGYTCEHWQNLSLNFEGCRWNHLELEFLNGAGTQNVVQRTTATELVEGEGIPERIRELANRESGIDNR